MIMNDAKRCPICKRSKTKAIKEQKALGTHCEVSNRGCYFYNEIKTALERKSNIKIIKKEKKIVKVFKKIKSQTNINRK